MRTSTTVGFLSSILAGVACVASMGVQADNVVVEPSSTEIRTLERRVKLPPQASALRTYVRYYYATGDAGPVGRSIEGIYVAKSQFKPSEIPPGDIVVAVKSPMCRFRKARNALCSSSPTLPATRQL